MKTLKIIATTSVAFGFYFAVFSGIQPFEPGAVILRWDPAVQAFWVNTVTAFLLQLNAVAAIGSLLGDREWLPRGIVRTVRRLSPARWVRGVIEKGNKDDEDNRRLGR